MFKTLIYNNILYPNFKIDENGNVLNCKTKTIYKKSIRKANGYLYAYLPLGKRGNTKCIRIHKAVAETFIPNPNNLSCINHIDENKQNCNINNLEWVTHKENVNKHLDIHINEHPNKRKLSFKEIKFIYDNVDKYSQRKLAKLLNISKTTIQRVLANKTYNNIKKIYGYSIKGQCTGL